MNPNGQRSDFVLSTTVTETILLLFFLLLLLLVFTVDHDHREIDKARAEAKQERLGCEAVRSELQSLEDRLSVVLPEEKSDDEKARLHRALVALTQVETMLAEERNKSDSLKREVEALKDIAIKVKQTLSADGMSHAEITDAVDRRACAALEKQVSGLETVNRILTAKDQSQSRELDDANKRNRDLQDRYTRIAREHGKGGDEYVACWKHGDDIDYIFQVYLDHGSVRVEKAWPPWREEDMQQFPAERSLVGKTVSLKEFLENTKDMFAASQQQSCRHFIEIVGKRSEMDRNNFMNYQGVQNHFYKKDSVK